MAKMPRAWGSYWARLSAGLGLLMLPAAAQPRVCLWLNQASAKAASAAGASKTGQPGAETSLPRQAG